MRFYHFFDYKYNIEGFSSDFFSLPHIIYIILVFSLAIAFPFIFKKANHKKIDIYLKVMSILALIFEISKISFESYYDITTGRGFNKEGILPLYTCSLFLYTLILAAWSKGKAKEISLSYLTTIGLIAGAIGTVYCNGLNFYPFWTFGAFYSLFFHSSMLLTGVLLLSCKYKVLTWNDILKSWIAIVILSAIAIPTNYIIHSDYMQLYSGDGVPLMSTLASFLGEHGLRFIFTIIMLFMYMPLAAIVVAVTRLIYLIVDNKDKKKNEVKKQVV